MTISTKITIDAPASKVWSVLVDDYMTLDTWMASIDRTRPLPSATGAQLARIAEIGAGAPGAWMEETASKMDLKTYKITITSKLRGLPSVAPLKGFTSDVQIREISPEKCEVTWDTLASLKVHGYLLSYGINKGLKAGFYRGLEELKHFVETGKPQPRKQKAFDRLETMAAA